MPSSFFQTFHAVYNITANERVNFKRYRYLMDGKGAFYNPFNRGIVHNLKEFFLLVKPRTEHDVEILNIWDLSFHIYFFLYAGTFFLYMLFKYIPGTQFVHEHWSCAIQIFYHVVVIKLRFYQCFLTHCLCLYNQLVQSEFIIIINQKTFTHSGHSTLATASCSDFHKIKHFHFWFDAD